MPHYIKLVVVDRLVRIDFIIRTTLLKYMVEKPLTDKLTRYSHEIVTINLLIAL